MLDNYSIDLLQIACELHEIRLSVEFKWAPLHAAWLVQSLDLPGFTPAQKKLLATLLLNQTNPLDLSSLHQQNSVPPRVAEHLCRLLRLAIIFSGWRHISWAQSSLSRRASDKATCTSRWKSNSPFTP